MKCEHCGYNLQLEDRFCPYCGKPNPFAAQHQREMQHFSREFQETKQTVLEKSSRFNRHTVRVTILAVLIACCAVMGFLCAGADDIRYWREEKRIRAEKGTYQARIEQLMEERDYTGLCSYMDRNRLSYTQDFRAYDTVYYASTAYMRFYENLLILQSKKQDPENYSYYTENDLFEEMAEKIEIMYEYREEDPYYPEELSEEKLAYLTDMTDTVEKILIRYFHISEEEAARVSGMTDARRAVLLEESYESQA